MRRIEIGMLPAPSIDFDLRTVQAGEIGLAGKRHARAEIEDAPAADHINGVIGAMGERAKLF